MLLYPEMDPRNWRWESEKVLLLTKNRVTRDVRNRRWKVKIDQYRTVRRGIELIEVTCSLHLHLLDQISSNLTKAAPDIT